MPDTHSGSPDPNNATSAVSNAITSTPNGHRPYLRFVHEMRIIAGLLVFAYLLVWSVEVWQANRPTSNTKPVPLNPLPKNPQPGDTWTNSVGMTLVWIPPGRFQMGSPVTEKGRQADERHHWVTLTKGFWMGQTEVTEEQWAHLSQCKVPQSQSKVTEDRAKLPVLGRTWHDWQEQLKGLSAWEGKTYALPTEAQWEYACRAGTTTAYHSGDAEADLAKVAWFQVVPHDHSRYLNPVRQKEPNRWGLYDMHGNIPEWCADWYGDYPEGETIDPAGPETGQTNGETGPYRVVRGGGGGTPPSMCRSASRGLREPGGPNLPRGGFDPGCRFVLLPD